MSLPPAVVCPVCNHLCEWHGVLDLHKTCGEETTGTPPPACGIPIHYARCDNCGFCFAPEICSWPLAMFEEKIYNSDYSQFDPEYLDIRPRANANLIISTFGNHAKAIRHLDYGGGEGLLSQLLRNAGFDSVSYDPFVNRDTDIKDLSQFDLITAFEVFEHVPDVNALMGNLQALLRPGGMLLFSTLLSDGHIAKGTPLDWWYAAPRNGHISLFSQVSIATLAKKYDFQFGSFNAALHACWTTLPPWAAHILRPC